MSQKILCLSFDYALAKAARDPPPPGVMDNYVVQFGDKTHWSYMHVTAPGKGDDGDAGLYFVTLSVHPHCGLRPGEVLDVAESVFDRFRHADVYLECLGEESGNSPCTKGRDRSSMMACSHMRAWMAERPCGRLQVTGSTPWILVVNRDKDCYPCLASMSAAEWLGEPNKD